jgi:hypothetical protein
MKIFPCRSRREEARSKMFYAHPPHEPQSRAGVSPAPRARQREQCVGFADAGRRDACPTFSATAVQGFKARISVWENSHPDPLPLGEGTAAGSFALCVRFSRRWPHQICRITGSVSPSPWGEGRGENSPNPSLRLEPLNRNRSAGLPTRRVGGRPQVRAGSETGAPVHGEGGRIN